MRTDDRLDDRLTPPAMLLAVLLAPAPVIDDPWEARVAFVLAAGSLVVARLAASIPHVLLQHGVPLGPDMHVGRWRTAGAVGWAAALAVVASPGSRGVAAGILGSLLAAVITTTPVGGARESVPAARRRTPPATPALRRTRERAAR